MRASIEGPALSAVEGRRYLINFDTEELPSVRVPLLVVGSGVAGLTAAVTSAERGVEVLLVTKDALSESNTEYAKGGIAAVLNPSDSFESHILDTLTCAQGLGQKATAEVVVREGADRIRDLIRRGVKFDRLGLDVASESPVPFGLELTAERLNSPGPSAATLGVPGGTSEFSLAREGGHSHPRILHARGDETGHEVESVLIKTAKAIPGITLRERVFAIDLLTRGERCVGVIALDRERGEKFVIWADFTLLATGGAGQLYRETTNPAVATADGLAMAYRAGAELADLEFVQFHPTTLYLAGAARSLISETVRGEGGLLRDRNGVHFMPNYHPLADLAPRDVVSRSIVRQMQLTGDTNVYLDLTGISPERIRSRFPTLWRLCKEFDINVARDYVPVRPSAHYMIGGVRTDLHARTILSNLYAVGEVASTGLNGANRLGSNSLLEGLVFGHRAGLDVARKLSSTRRQVQPHVASGRLRSRAKIPRGGGVDFGDAANSLKATMWRHVGIERDEKGLREALSKMAFWSSYLLDKEFDVLDGWILQNMLTVATLVTASALERKETRGAHIRIDFPDPNDSLFRRSLVVKRPMPHSP